MRTILRRRLLPHFNFLGIRLDTRFIFNVNARGVQIVLRVDFVELKRGISRNCSFTCDNADLCVLCIHEWFG